jgi:hypothetical protein
MTEESNNDANLADLESAAITVSVSILVFFVIYWAAQIDTTYELLAMAYGW